MKNIYNIYEGLLDDIEKTLNENPVKKLYPIPSIKDFQKGSFKQTNLAWPCKYIIQPYIDKFAHKDDIYKYLRPSEEIIGLWFTIYYDNIIEVCLMTNDMLPHLKIPGIGDYCENKPAAKREIIEFCKKLVNNPELMQKVVDFSNKFDAEIKRTRVADHIRLKDVI